MFIISINLLKEQFLFCLSSLKHCSEREDHSGSLGCAGAGGVIVTRQSQWPHSSPDTPLNPA